MQTGTKQEFVAYKPSSGGDPFNNITVVDENIKQQTKNQIEGSAAE